MISETYGVRLPPAKHCLTAVNFDLIPNKPPPQDPASSPEDDEDDEEDEDEEDDEAMDEDPPIAMEVDTPAAGAGAPDVSMEMASAAPDTLGLSTGIRMADDEAGEGDGEGALAVVEEEEGGGSDDDDDDDDSGDDGNLFHDGDEDEEEDEDMEGAEASGSGAAAAPQTNGDPQVGDKRKLSVDDDYD